MGTYNDNLILNFLIGTDALIPYMNQVMTKGKQVGNLISKGIIDPKGLEKVKAVLGKNKKVLDAFNVGVSESINKQKELKNRFNMNSLSFLFAGMAMERFGMSIIRFVIPSMDKLEKLNTIVARKVMGVAAAFEFMKISIFETLMTQGWFEDFVVWLIKTFIALSDWAQQHPGWVKAIVAVAGAIAALGIAWKTGSMLYQIGHGFSLMWDKIAEWIGYDGKGGKIGGTFDSFKNFLTSDFLKGIIVTGSIIVAGLAINDLIKSIKDKDWGGTFGYAIAAAFALVGGIMALFVPGVGLLLTLFAVAVLAVTAATVDDRKAEQAIKKWAESKGKKYQAKEPLTGEMFNQDMLNTDIVNPAITGQLEKDRLDLKTQALNDYYNEYKSVTGALNDLNKKFNSMDATEETKKIALKSKINTLMAQQSEITSGIISIEGQVGLTKINQLQSELTIHQEAMEALSKKGTKVKEVTDVEIAQYASVFSEQLKSKEETDKLIENTTAFGKAVMDTFGGTKTSVGVIGQFNAFGKEILDDNTYFDALKADINAWAAVETVKIIKIKYVTEGSSGETGGKEGTFEKAGKVVDKAVGSITGGKKK